MSTTLPRSAVLLPSPSPEQQAAIRLFLDTDKNLIVNACAGSGKTTLILQLAAASPERRFLVLMYNAPLMVSTQMKVDALGLRNVRVINFHKLGYRCYTRECSTDEGLKRTVSEGLPPRRLTEVLGRFDVLVLDELQDMTDVIYRFVEKVCVDACGMGAQRKKVRFVLVGDPRQGIYGYRGAHAHFLTLADREEVFGRLAGGAGPDHWEKVALNMSFRLSGPIVKFLNKQVLNPEPGTELLAASSDPISPLPRLISCDLTDPSALEDMCERIDRFHADGIPSDEIAIVVPSFKYSIQAKNLANKLSLAGYAVHAPDFNVDNPRGPAPKNQRDPRKGKIRISSYHQEKGNEARVVIVLGFDGSDDRPYRNSPVPGRRACPAHYVALTRSKEHLLMVRSPGKGYPPFIEAATLRDSCVVEGGDPSVGEDPSVQAHEKAAKPKIFSPELLLSTVVDGVKKECISLLCLEPIWYSNPSTQLYPPPVIQSSKELLEDVSGITSTAITAIYEYQREKTCQSFETILNRKQVSLLPQSHVDKISEAVQKIRTKTAAPSDFLYLANFSKAEKSGYINQCINLPLSAYDWITKHHVAGICENIGRIVRPGSQRLVYERTVKATFRFAPSGGGGETEFHLLGSPDILKGSAVYELKAGLFDADAILQAVWYAAIVECKGSRPEASATLIDPFCGKAMSISPKCEGAFRQVVEKLVNAKLEGQDPKSPLSDEEFLKSGFTVAAPVLPAWVSGSDFIWNRMVRNNHSDKKRG